MVVFLNLLCEKMVKHPKVVKVLNYIMIYFIKNGAKDFFEMLIQSKDLLKNLDLAHEKLSVCYLCLKYGMVDLAGFMFENGYPARANLDQEYQLISGFVEEDDVSKV